MGVRADVPEDAVHAVEAGAGADARVVIVGHGVEEGDAAAGLQDLVVGGSKQAVGQAVPVVGKGRKKYAIRGAQPMSHDLNVGCRACVGRTAHPAPPNLLHCSTYNVSGGPLYWSRSGKG